MMTEKNNAIAIIVEDILSNLDLKIKRLNETDAVKHSNEIKFLEYLQSNFIRLADYRDQILNLIPYYQNEITSNWDNVTDGKFELEKKKHQVESLKEQVGSIQREELNLQKEKKQLSKKLKKNEFDIIRNQKKFNKKGHELEQLHSRIEIISKLETDQNDTFLNRFFESRNKIQTKRLSRIVSDRVVETNNLSEQIETKQEEISRTSEEIEYQQTRLKQLQIENIKLRNEIQTVLNSIKENGLQIQKTETQIEKHNRILQQLSISLVDIANETTRQHAIYKKSSLAPLDDIDFQNLIQESTSSHILEEDLEKILASQNSLLDQSDN